MKELNTVNLTTNQKRVIAKIVASPTPKVAAQEVSGDQNMVAARNELAKLGAIHFVGGECSLTDIGERLAQEDNIADASGQLTPDGQALAYTDAKGEEDKDVTQQPPQTPQAGMPGAGVPPAAPAAPGPEQGLMMSHTPKYEPLELLRELMEHAMVVEPSGEITVYDDAPHKYLQDLVKGLKAQGKTHEEILQHVKKHKELRLPPMEDEEKVTKKAGTGRLFTIDEVRARAREEKAKVAPRKPSTPDQRMKARARHWRKTGVSDSTVEWMKKNGML